MKNTLTYYIICLILAFLITFSLDAQQLSPIATNAHADGVIKKEHRRERVRAEKKEKRIAKAEKRLNTKAQYKKRRKSKIKQERT